MGGLKTKTLLYFSYSTAHCELCYTEAMIIYRTRNIIESEDEAVHISHHLFIPLPCLRSCIA